MGTGKTGRRVEGREKLRTHVGHNEIRAPTCARDRSNRKCENLSSALSVRGNRPARQGSREIADTPVIRAPARGIFGLDALALSSLALPCHRCTGKRGPGPGEG